MPMPRGYSVVGRPCERMERAISPRPPTRSISITRVVEKRGLLKVDVHVGDHAGQNKEGAGHGEHPSDGAATVKKENCHAEQQRDEGDAKAVRAPERPV